MHWHCMCMAINTRFQIRFFFLLSLTFPLLTNGSAEVFQNPSSSPALPRPPPHPLQVAQDGDANAAGQRHVQVHGRRRATASACHRPLQHVQGGRPHQLLDGRPALDATEVRFRGLLFLSNSEVAFWIMKCCKWHFSSPSTSVQLGLLEMLVATVDSLRKE